MSCPECKAKDRLCIKNGFVYRKLAVTPERAMGAKVRRYLCTVCGYTGRGKFFGRPEFDSPEESPVEEIGTNAE